MSVIPAQGERLDLFEGSTLDETFSFTDEDGAALNLTGWSAALKVRQTFDSDVILAVASGALTPGPNASAILLGGVAGTARVYVGSTIMAALNASQFKQGKDDGETIFTGVWDLELTNASAETFRYIMGPVYFSREVTA